MWRWTHTPIQSCSIYQWRITDRQTSNYVPVPLFFFALLIWRLSVQHNLPPLVNVTTIGMLTEQQTTAYLAGYNLPIYNAIAECKEAIRVEIGCTAGVWFSRYYFSSSLECQEIVELYKSEAIFAFVHFGNLLSWKGTLDRQACTEVKPAPHLSSFTSASDTREIGLNHDTRRKAWKFHFLILSSETHVWQLVIDHRSSIISHLTILRLTLSGRRGND